MEIALVADFGNRFSGSFIPNVCALARKVTERGDGLTLISARVDGATWHERVRESGAELVLTSSGREVFDALRKRRPAIVHTHFLGYTLPATLAATLTRARLIWHLHSGIPPSSGRWRRQRSRLRYQVLGRKTHRFVAVSHALAHELFACGLDPRRTIVVGNAVDTSHFRPPAPPERAAARAALGLNENSFVLGFFGRDSYVKGTDILLQALDEVDDVTLLAVGLPPKDRTGAESSGRALTIDASPDPRAIYWACDALALPSRVEAAPYTLMEALCCGLPVIASDLPAIRETAGDAASVRFFPAGDWMQLRSALRQLVDRAWTVAPLDPAVQERLTLDRWVADVLRLYD
ncbi:MAG: glycosyltransferase family 4 protein [Candidatus Eremiobacteraeota bacterium]|nr:glycosyltransferase family 4 protein [Candidatus Eremiobacteraeota bacterium]MBV8354185.1 glycosyltransferase family 4 protein [Candidatus Eremiobacteraeota bacterium]